MSKKFFAASASSKTFPLTLLRDSLLPTLTGPDGDILYWAGKKIAREFILIKDEELSLFFAEAGWGRLSRIKSQKGTQTFELTGPVIESRQKVIEQPNYLLEAGFLAETIQNQLGRRTEALVSSQKKDTVTILVKVDLNNPLSLNEPDPANIVNLLTEE